MTRVESVFAASLTVGRWTVRAWIDASSPWRDGHSKWFSLTKILATIGVLLVCYSVWASKDHAISVNHVVVLLASLAAAFGKSTFNFFLTKWSGESKRVETDVHEDKHAESIITETKRIEAHYTLDGVPAKSLPANPDARTPGGDE